MSNVVINLDSSYPTTVVKLQHQNTVSVNLAPSKTIEVIPDSLTIQTLWDSASSTNKNTFVDANQTEILTFSDGLTWDELISVNGRGYAYPVASQVTSYRTGDEAYIEANVFGPLRAANALKPINPIDPTDFTKVLNNNAFGNKNRFTNTVGGSVSDGSDGSIANYFIDHHTGLGICTNVFGSNVWNDCIDNGYASTQGGLSGWFVLSPNQYQSIVNNDALNVFDYAPLNIVTASNLFTSTTRSDATYQAYYVANSYNQIRNALKTSANYYLIGRKHY